jgi:uncharacterized protein (UPF0147 family)
MKKDINKMIEDGFELAQKHENLRNEIINDENVPKELRDELMKLKDEFEQQKNADDKYIKENKHRKIVGYSENFMPIYEDEK